MLELENLDDVSFSELMKKCVSEIPQLCSRWTDFNAHDPGITFLEMLMWLTEMQRYYLSQITEDHLESYLRLIGTTVRSAEPTVILARFFSEETVLIKKETVFHIGEIPFRSAEDIVIASEKPEIILCENGSIIVKQDFTPFKGRTVPLYFSPDDEIDTNPMRDGFYSQAEIKAALITQKGEVKCSVKDGTYGLYQRGFINVSLPVELDDSTAVLRLDILSDNNFRLPSASRFNSDIHRLIQLDKKGNTLGGEGRVKEKVSFSADIEGKKIFAEVYREFKNGRNAETPQDAFKRFKSEQHFPRAVNKDDYERIALKTPGLNAEFVNVFSKEPGKVSVRVKTVSGNLYENEIKNLRKVLFEAKPIGTEIEILTPVTFTARLVISAKTDGWSGVGKLTEYARYVFEPLGKCMGALIDMPRLFKQIGSFSIVSEIKSMHLRLGKGIELTEKDTVKLPEDGLLSLDEVIIQ